MSVSRSVSKDVVVHPATFLKKIIPDLKFICGTIEAFSRAFDLSFITTLIR